MKQYRKAYYKAKLGDGKWVDDGISIYTTVVNVIWLCCKLQFKTAWQVLKRRYSHVEVWMPDENGEFTLRIPCKYWEGRMIGDEEEYHKTLYLGHCFTSTMRGEVNGTVIRQARDVLGKHPERWDIQFYECSDEDYEDAVEWAEWQAEHNVGYNTATIANFFNPFRKTVISKDHFLPPRRKNICSVACQGFDWMAGLFKKWCIWSPLKLWYKTDKLGFPTKPLTEC